ncbi:DoxX family protein [Burkholderiaceae bacterium DAT-1]|nr:DoxX family protein [Burkholderiaceae bacterium DAT-1]
MIDFHWIRPIWQRWERLNDLAAHLFSLVIRLYLFRVFAQSGWLKLSSWDSTLYLFREEYHVPVLPPEFAATLATAGELILPSILLIGFAHRFAAPGLFILNLVAVLSYPDLGPVEIKDHVLWGSLIAVVWFHGTGALSLDGWLTRRARCRPMPIQDA